MVNNTIIKYLKKGLKEGHSLNSLKGALLKQGYPAADVDEAVRQVSPAPKTEVGKKPLVVAILVMSIIAIVVAALLIYPRLRKPALEGLELLEEELWQELLTYTNSSYDGYYTDIAVQFAFKKNDSSVCTVLRTTELRDNCFKFLAQISEDFSLCGKISDEREKGMCYGSSKSTLLCDNAYSSDPRGKAECYSYVARRNNKSEICGTLAGIDKEWCYIYVAVPENDSSVCGEMSNEWANACLAMINRDAAYCEKITNENVRWMCVAELTKDTSICEKVKRENYIVNKDVCYDILKRRRYYKEEEILSPE